MKLNNNIEVRPNKNIYDLEAFKWDMVRIAWNKYDYNDIQDLDECIEDLVDAIFGTVDFAGEVINVIIPLDNGKMFFPLGTSAGWSNKVGDIDILFKVPESSSLDLPKTKDAYFDCHHWYLLQMSNANPDYDLESSVKTADSNRQTSMERAAFIYDNARAISMLIMIIIFLSIFIAFVYIYRYISHTGKQPVFKNYSIWLLLGLSFLISIPGALLLYFLVRPIPPNQIKDKLAPAAIIIFYPISIILFLLVVML